MRLLIVVVITSILLESCAYGVRIYRPKNNVESTKKQALIIMKELSIQTRDSTHKDGYVIYSVYPSPIMSGHFFPNSMNYFVYLDGSFDTAARFYPNPSLSCSSIQDSIFKRKVDTSKQIYIKSVANMIHEYVHYYQNAYIEDSLYIPFSSVNPTPHIKQRIEFEAYTVHCYYYLMIFKNKELKKIMKQKVDVYTRNKNIINAGFKLLYPQLSINL